VVDAGDFDDTVGIGAATGSTVTYEALGGAGNDVLANTSRQFSAALDGGTGTDRCARGTTRDVLVACEVIP
jgi:hypothetical protein